MIILIILSLVLSLISLLFSAAHLMSFSLTPIYHFCLHLHPAVLFLLSSTLFVLTLLSLLPTFLTLTNTFKSIWLPPPYIMHPHLLFSFSFLALFLFFTAIQFFVSAFLHPLWLGKLNILLLVWFPAVQLQGSVNYHPTVTFLHLVTLTRAKRQRNPREENTGEFWLHV